VGTSLGPPDHGQRRGQGCIEDLVRSPGMGDFVKLARIADVPPGTGRVVDAGGTPIALFNIDGKIHAIHNTCLHRQGPLGEGEVTGSVLVRSV
jgi:nitrite reductase/ring-hydroxylating ferredoxin subunit